MTLPEFTVKHFARLFLMLMVGILVFAQPLKADMGPKPSVTIRFTNTGTAGTFYAALLSKDSEVTLWHYEEGLYGDITDPAGLSEQDQIDFRFYMYSLHDDYYYFSHTAQKITAGEYSWSYYAPGNFKLLVFFPDSDTFMISDAYERTAFQAVYRCDVSNERLVLVEYIDWSTVIIGFLARVAGTVLVELLIGLLFGYRRKKQVIGIIITNIITQILLNLYVYLVNYHEGFLVVMLTVFIVEGVIIVIEAIVYRIFLRQGHPILYALVANCVSFVAGLLLAVLLPGLF